VCIINHKCAKRKGGKSFLVFGYQSVLGQFWTMTCILCKDVFFDNGVGGGGGEVGRRGPIKQETNEHKRARTLSCTHMIELSLWANYKMDKSIFIIWLENTPSIKVIWGLMLNMI
jgi:hypothetical protein